MVRLRNAPNAPSSPAKTRTKRQALQEKTNVTVDPQPSDSGKHSSPNDFIKDVKTRGIRGRAKQGTQNEDAFVMSGALVQSKTNPPVLVRDNPISRENVQDNDVPVSLASNRGRRVPRISEMQGDIRAQGSVLGALKDRMEATAREEAGKRNQQITAKERVTEQSSDRPAQNDVTARHSALPARERSELSMSSSPSPPTKRASRVDKRSSLAQPGSALRPQRTPTAETSILALKNFKRRPRQPSMLQMVQQRTQSARPSAVHASTHDETSVFDLGESSGEGEEDDFAPDAEGTPLHVTSAKERLSTSAQRRVHGEASNLMTAQTNGNARKRSSNHVDSPSTALGALHAKRRKAHSASYDDAERRPSVESNRDVERPVIEQEASPEPGQAPDILVLHSSPLSSTRGASPDEEFAVPSTEQEHIVAASALIHQDSIDQRASTPPIGTMADPISSSPPPPDSVTRHHPDILADPVTQVSPPRPERRNARKDKLKPMSTATLQSLLPKRRQPPKARRARRTEYDFVSSSEVEEDLTLDASHLSSDEDELSGRLRKQTRTAPIKARTSRTKASKPIKPKTKTPQRSRASKAPTTAQARKSTIAPPSATRRTAQQQHKTYGRRAGADKENTNAAGSPSRFENQEEFDEEDTTNDVLLPVAETSIIESAELEAAKRKFAAVDEWDMEFESMSVEEHRSSSLQWR